MNAKTKLRQFDKKTKQKILDRDGGCIFCRIGYHMKATDSFQYKILDIMHIVNKSQCGLGIEQNAVVGCRYHHGLLDNGSKGLRAEMLEHIESYMKEYYPDWNRDDLIYKRVL